VRIARPHALAVATLPVAAALLAAVPTLPAAAAGTTPDPSTPAGWTTPLHLGGGGGEPSIRVGSDGKAAAYISAPSGLGSNFWSVAEKVNSDGSHTLIGSAPQQPDLGTGGGDSEISVGNAPDPKTGCDTIAYSGLHNIDLLDNFTVASSTDCGKTFSLLNPYATQNTLTDRQWQTFDGAKTNHLIYHNIASGQIVDDLSQDGGQTYLTQSTPGAPATGEVDANHLYTVQQLKIGNIVTDYSSPVAGKKYPISGEQVHTLYATFAGVRDAADFLASENDSNYDHLNTIYVARSDDGGLTWTDTTAFSTAPTERRELDLIFPVIAVDKAGNLYDAWTDGNLIQYVASTDHGKTWSKPYTVNPGEAGAQKTDGTADLFPWLAAGSDGNLDVVWYHGQGGDTTGYRNVGNADATKGPVTQWTVAFAQLTNATHADPLGGTAAPTVATKSLAVTPVMHKGNVCNNGTTCGITDTGDRTLLDFFQVAIDNAGRANIAYANDTAQPGTSEIYYTRQNSGQSLIDGSAVPTATIAPLPGPVCDAAATITDPAGDATGAAVVDSTPAPSDDTLDVLSAHLSEAAGALVFHVNVKNLSATPEGADFRYYFTYGNTSYFLFLDRSTAGVTSFSLKRYDGTTAGTTTLKSGLVGAFDNAANEARVALPLDVFNATAKPATPLANGKQLTGFQVLAQRDTGLATLTADTANGACPYTVGSAAAAGGADATLPEVPYAGLLPLGAVAVAAAFLTRRRRRA